MSPVFDVMETKGFDSRCLLHQKQGTFNIARHLEIAFYGLTFNVLILCVYFNLHNFSDIARF